jgi:hypothetical protein
MAETRALRTEDVVPVGSRISWGAIFAGAAIGLSAFFLLALLGGSIGLSARDNVTADTFGTAASIWAIVSAVLAFLVAGFIASQCTVGENYGEAVIHGLVTWAVMLVLVLSLAAMGVRAGFNAILGVAAVGQTAVQGTGETWDALARRAGATDADIERLRNSMTASADQAQDPVNQEAAAETAEKASWWSLFGAMVSMAAAAVGAFLGAGPQIRLFGWSAPAGTVTRVRTPAHAP